MATRVRGEGGDLTELTKANVPNLSRFGEGTFDPLVWATPPLLAQKLWGQRPWATHLFTDDVANSFGPQYEALYESPLPPSPQIVTLANSWASPEGLVSAIQAGASPTFLATPPPPWIQSIATRTLLPTVGP